MRVRLLACSLLVAALAPFGARAHFEEHPVEFSGATPCGWICADYLLPQQPCAMDALPPGSYADILTEPAPEPPPARKLILVLEVRPKIDWDIFICSYPDYRLVSRFFCICGENCDNPLGPDSPIPIGCSEKVQAPAQAGNQYVLRAYNVSDIFPAPGSYRWVFV